MNLARPNELFLAGLRIANRYRVLRLLDRDGLSFTFEAEEIESGVAGQPPKLVLRVFNVADGERINVAWQELERFKDLRHDMLAMPKSIGQVPAGEPLAGALYVTRELGERSLQELIHTTGPLDGDEMQRFASHLSEALVHIHHNNLVHMDITPGNVIRMRGWKLGEPSITRLIDRDASVEEMLLPEARYLAPEYVHGGPAPEADVYSFGAVIEYATLGRVAESWASPAFHREAEQEASGAHAEPPRQPKIYLDSWFAISALCRAPEPLVRPSAQLLRELVTLVGSSAAPLLPMLSHDGAYRRSLEAVRDLWQRSGFEAVPGGQRKLSMTVSDATIGVLRECRELSVAPSLSVAHLEHQLIVASHRLIGERFGALDTIRRPSPLRTHWDEDVVPPLDGARAWLSSLLTRLRELIPFARRKPQRLTLATTASWERLLEQRPDSEFQAHVRERISNHLRALADPALEATRRGGLESDPDRIAEAVLEELSLTAAARERIRAEEQIGAGELALRREGSPQMLESMTRTLAEEGALALPVGDGYRYLTFQFDPHWQVIAEVAAANRTLGAATDPWGAASWWISPNGRIGGRVPRDLVGEDPQTIIQIAGAVVETVG
jgi:serine/threonine protein kinase